MSEIEALLARVEAAPGPDRELDLALFELCEPEKFQRAYWDCYGSLNRHLPKDEADILARRCMRPPYYTASLDAKLPGENIVSSCLTPRGWCAVHRMGVTGAYEDFYGCGHTEPLARRAAALRAMMEKRDGD